MSRMGGSRWTRLVREVLAEDDVCWLCGRAGADSGDHVIPVSVRPDLEYIRDNVRPAHLLCNKKRGAKPVGVPPRTHTSRRW